MSFAEFRCRDTGCVVYYNFLISQPWRVRSRQGQAITNWSWSILAVFEITRVQESRTPDNTEKIPPAHGHSILQLTLAQCSPTVQPLYETLEIQTGAPQGNEIRASEENSWLLVAKPFTSFNIFEKFEFSKFRCHETVCLVTYNFLISQP